MPMVWVNVDIYRIRARYTDPGNFCKGEQIAKLAHIAIAHDISTLVGEIEELRSMLSKMQAELNACRGAQL